MTGTLRSTSMRGRLAASATVCVLAGALAFSQSGCGEDPTGNPTGNIQPRVRLTAGPQQNSTEFYSVPFSWTAWDDDGFVDHFLYAIDDTVGVPGDSTSGWQSTRQHTKTLVFSATTRADSITYTGFHTFYLKAVDNDGLASPPAQLSFNAKTTAPNSEFLIPSRVAAGEGFNSPLQGGPSIRLEWKGEDVDGVRSNKPVKYILSRAQTNAFGDIGAATRALTSPEAQTFEVDGTQTFFVFNDLAQSGQNVIWVFGLQAVDEAGAIEPFFRRPGGDPGPNVFFFQAQGNLQGPALGIFSVALGFFIAQGVSRDSSQYVFDQAISMVWGADASTYGATVDAYRWGVDVQDVSDDRDPGWGSGWSATLTTINGLRFADRTQPLHDIVVQARDSNGNITSGFVRLRLVEFPLDKDVLYVDDEFENPIVGFYPSNMENQSWARDVIGAALHNLGRPTTIDVLSPFLNETSHLDVRFPALTDLARYRVIVWQIGQSTLQNTFFSLAAVDPNVGPLRSNILATYLESGGNLVIAGQRPLASTISAGGSPPVASPITSSQGLAPGQNNFALDYWGVPAKIYSTGATQRRGDALIGLEPTQYGRTHGFLGGWPRLDLDTEKWNRLTGITTSEAFDAPPRNGTGRDFAEPIATYLASGGPTGPNGSLLHGKYSLLLYKRASDSPNADWKFQVLYAPHRLYSFKRDQVVALFTNTLYEFLNDKKWGAARAAPPRPTPNVTQDPGAGDAASLAAHR